jgi:16S rRNA (adenine1518-N6/adenine1519-N6)-dimethyltransferase
MNSAASPLKARSILEQFKIKPRKSLGQNFLVSAGARELIIQAAELETEDQVLEIGSGLGALTERLIQEAGFVVAIELDEAIYSVLESNFREVGNLKLIQGNILEIQPSDLGLHPGYVVVANIPYNITSAVIRHLMESDRPAAHIVLTIQREVAERIMARPGEMSLLALSVQIFGVPSIQAHLSAGSFFPVPSVESAVVRIDMQQHPSVRAGNVDTIFKLARAGFAQKRKQLKNSLAHGLPLDRERAEQLLLSCGIDPRARAQTLGVEQWASLAQSFDEFTQG